MNQFETVAVIGAGVMGAGIAAQFASAGVAVTLLDLDPACAASAISRQRKSGGLADHAAGTRIQTGSSVSDLYLLAGADWIIESISERADAKRNLYAAIAPIRKPGAILSSNTSTILAASLTNEMDLATAQNFLITHFFNPPHLMPLLELVAGPATRLEIVASVASFATDRLGKSVVVAKDTPGFIANRVGNFWMAATFNEAVAQGLDIEDADAILRGCFGLPAGIFAFADLVGIDLMPPVWRSLQSALPPTDALQSFPVEPPVIAGLIKDGRTGRKAGAGFMRRRQDGAFDVLDLTTMLYRPMREPNPAIKGIEATALMAQHDPFGRFALRAMGRTMAYAASLVPKVAEEPSLIDRAMRDGYGWRVGPFEMIDRIGAAFLADRLASISIPVPPQPVGEVADEPPACLKPRPACSPRLCALPAGAWDTHAHVIGGGPDMPFVSGRSYTPPPASPDEYVAMLDVVGLAYGVVIQISTHGHDNRLIADALRRYPTRLRGVVSLSGSETEAELATLRDLGVCGIRINEHFAGGSTAADLERLAAKCRPLGWHIDLGLTGARLRKLAPVLRRLDMCLVIDHMGFCPPHLGIGNEDFQAVLELARMDKCWIKLSAAYRLSTRPPPYDDVAPFTRALCAAAPGRTIWASDWPNVAITDPAKLPDAGEQLDALFVHLSDQAQFRRVLVDNPQALFRPA